jgi:hypothetical protein
MGVFANLIPGIREVRAPLAAGGITLLTIALVIEPQVPDRGSATGLAASIIAVAEGMGPVGRGVVVSFAAYLIGSVLQGASASIYFVASFARIGSSPASDVLEGESQLEPAMRDRVADAFSEIEESFGWDPRAMAKAGHLKELDSFQVLNAIVARDAKGNDGGERLYESDVEAISVPLAQRIVRERRTIRLRLLGAEPEWYGLVDRLQAEADLREAILVPLLALGAVCAVRAPNPIAAVSIFAGVVVFTRILFVQADRSRRRANYALIDGVAVGRVQAPAFERFEADLATALARAKSMS